MKKFLKVTAVVLLLLVVGLGVALYFTLNSAVKTAVVTVLPRMTKSAVVLDTVDISLFSGKGTLNGLVIGNPEGYKTPNAFSLGTVRVDVDLSSLLTDTVVIEDVFIDAPKVTYEMGSPSNIGAIRKNIEEFAGPSAGAGKEGEKKPGKKVIINHFLMQNGSIALSATILQGQALTVPLPTIEMRDIGKDSGGTSVGKVADQVFGKISSGVEGAAKGGLSRAKELVGEAGKGAVDAGKKAAGGAVDGIKGIFGGGKKEGKK